MTTADTNATTTTTAASGEEWKTLTKGNRPTGQKVAAPQPQLPSNTFQVLACELSSEDFPSLETSSRNTTARPSGNNSQAFGPSSAQLRRELSSTTSLTTTSKVHTVQTKSSSNSSFCACSSSNSISSFSCCGPPAQCDEQSNATLLNSLSELTPCRPLEHPASVLPMAGEDWLDRAAPQLRQTIRPPGAAPPGAKPKPGAAPPGARPQPKAAPPGG